MNANEFYDILKQDPLFRGVYACDKLPFNDLPRPCALVVNTDVSSGAGIHWVVIVLTLSGPNEYFDSFGFPPQVPFIIQFLNNTQPYHFIYNNKLLQHPLAISCGRYCVEFIKWRSNSKPMTTFTNRFTENLKKNELILPKLDRRPAYLS